MRTFLISVFCLWCLSALCAQAQSDPVFQLLRTLTDWHQANPAEKAYLTTDKPLYAPGETIWFAAWVLNGQDHTLTSPSGVLTVELLSAENKIIHSERVRIENGRGHGDIYLPDTTLQGVYTIRAYTNWMRNAGDSYFFHKDVFVTGSNDLGRQEARIEMAGSNIQVDLNTTREVTVHIDSTNDQLIDFRIQAPTHIKMPLSIIAHVRGLVGFVARSNEHSSEFLGSIPRSQFQDGIIHFTVFDAIGSPVAEKLLFNDTGDSAVLTVTPDRSTYRTRELVTLELALTDASGNPVEGSFSASIVNEASIPDSLWQGATIKDWLLLRSDLRFGADIRIDDHSNIDSVLTTRSWDRLTWASLNNEQSPPTFALETDLPIRGRVVDDITKRAARDQDVTIYVMGDTQEVIQLYTDQDGYFQSPLFVQDTSYVMIQTRNAKGRKHYDIRLDSFEPTPAGISRTMQTPARVDFFNYLTSARQRLSDERAYGLDPNFKLLGEILVEAQREQDMANWWFKPTTGANFRMDAADAKHNARTAIDMLRGAHGKFVLLHDQVLVFSRGSRVPARIYIDGVESDLLEASTLPIEWIDHMELIWDSALMLATSFMGQDLRPLVAFYTKRDRDLVARQQGMVNIKYPGYASARAFMSPDYSVPDPAHEMPDRRITLHWEPVVRIDNGGKATITFWTGDLVGSFNVVVEGIAADGVPIVLGTSMNVSK
jgi:hypothetical protein